MAYNKQYKDFLEISPNFESVVDIDADKRNQNLWREYIVGDDMENLVDVLCQSLGNEAPDARRSFWVHGSYGTGKSYAATPRDTEVIAAIDALQNEKARVLTDAQKVYAALYETVGSEYVTYFKVHRPELLAKLKLSHGNDMSTWEAPELSRLQSMMKSAIQQQARQEKLQNTKNEIAEMPVSRLRENIASFLDNHPEYCDEFLK